MTYPGRITISDVYAAAAMGQPVTPGLAFGVPPSAYADLSTIGHDRNDVHGPGHEKKAGVPTWLKWVGGLGAAALTAYGAVRYGLVGAIRAGISGRAGAGLASSIGTQLATWGRGVGGRVSTLFSRSSGAGLGDRLANFFRRPGATPPAPPPVTP